MKPPIRTPGATSPSSPSLGSAASSISADSILTGPQRAPRGAQRTCKTWAAEAAMRMLMNNLDPEVAEDPANLVVYGGTGRAARSWEAFDAIVSSLKTLASDETLLVQSGKPVGVFTTHKWAPREIGRASCRER